MAASYEAPFNETHCWGRYRETLLGECALLRVIEFHEGGRTSVHRHNVTETLVVVAGTIQYLMGEDPHALTKETLYVGDVIRVEANIWHAAEYLSAGGPDGYALAVEYVAGDIQEGNYQITRAIGARPSNIRSRERSLPASS